MEKELAAKPSSFSLLAGSKGLEPSASGVTGRRYNQLNYDPKLFISWWAEQGSNLRPPACKADALPAELSALP